MSAQAVQEVLGGAGAGAHQKALCASGAPQDLLAPGDCAASAEALEPVSDAASTEPVSDAASDSSGDEDDEDCQVPPEDTILIFDWDDTVLPSSWLHEHGLSLADDSWPDVEQQAQLDRLSERAAHTLGAAARHGQVILVTNAEAGWIELSCQKFMPLLWPFLQGIKLFSARSEYEHQGVASPFEWKYLAFEREIGGFYEAREAGQRKNVVSFGDSAHEREALIRVTERMCSCRTKSLKLVERPDVEQLLKEHQLLADCMRSIVSHDGNLDLCISCA